MAYKEFEHIIRVGIAKSIMDHLVMVDDNDTDFATVIIDDHEIRFTITVDNIITTVTIMCYIDDSIISLNSLHHENGFAIESTKGTSDGSLFSYSAIAKKVLSIANAFISESIKTNLDKNKKLASDMYKLFKQVSYKNIQITQIDINIIGSKFEDRPYIIKYRDLASKPLSRKNAYDRLNNLMAELQKLID